jgi:serine O-acetyltransferase
METFHEFAKYIYNTKKQALAYIPDRHQTERFIIELMKLLFGQGCAKNEEVITNCLNGLKVEFTRLLETCYDDDDHMADHMADKFFVRLLPVYRSLLEDASFIESSDPAARSIDEVIVTYPGFWATAVHRFAHELYKLDIPYIPRLMSEYAHNCTGIDIHPGATIGTPFAIDHGTGLVIGETSIIGKRVRIYQGVTLGALIVDKSHATRKRHPTIEDDVVLYAGCTILGGNVTIGHHSVIGGNTWLTTSVPPYSVAYHTHKITIRSQSVGESPIDFYI